MRAQFVGGERRELFKDSAGTAARSFDQYLLLYYAAALCVIVRRRWRSAYRERHYRLGPLLLLAIQSASMVGIARCPCGSQRWRTLRPVEQFPFPSVQLGGGGAAAWYWWRNPAQLVVFQRHRQRVSARIIVVVLAAAAFVGGYVLGSGPSWARLPGPYMAAADTRSMDAEALAAVKWSREALPAGSRIAADRVSSDLLAAPGRPLAGDEGT